MVNLPKFLLFGEKDAATESMIQSTLELRSWVNLSAEEKQIAIRELINAGWVDSNSKEILNTIEYLNKTFLRRCPGKHLHGIKPKYEVRYPGIVNQSERENAALMDFHSIFLQELSDALVFRMLSKLAFCYIDQYKYGEANRATNVVERERLVNESFQKFDRFANCLNHIFEQFAVNQLVTRNGFVPRQDSKIADEIYTPVLIVLSDPKWQTVSADLFEMFSDFGDENYPETITKAHRAIQRFLQIIAGEEGKNAKGEVGELFKVAKRMELVPINRFTEPFIDSLQKFVVSERATNSTAKPTTKTATCSDALLVMNLTMVFLQHCLQKTK